MEDLLGLAEVDSLARRPNGLSREEIGKHNARVFLGQRAILGPTLVVPLWIVWKEYQAFGERNGLEVEAIHLRRLLDEANWAEVIERPEARGKLKTIVKGLGLLPSH